MPHLIYIANVRLPTEKAHGLQIMQMCEALAADEAPLELWVARRFNTEAMRAIEDVFAYYGVEPRFRVRWLPTLDLLPLVPGRTDAPARLIFYLQLFTFMLSAGLRLLFTPADLVYTRDARIARLANWLKPGRVVYEAHQLAVSQAGQRNQRAILHAARLVICLTPGLQHDLQALAPAADPARFMVAHDGVREGRFAGLPGAAAARRRLGWPGSAFVVGYVGRLHTMKQEKGVGVLVEALAGVDGAHVALVGGPDDMAAAYRDQWHGLGLPDERFLYLPHVPPAQVPLCMVAMDVCVMALPFTPHFAYHASPLKLFEYMASGRAVVVTDLPGWADVVRHEENALLVPPSDPAALRDALKRLQAEPTLRSRLGEQARRDVLAHYTWAARAARILGQVNS